MIVNLLAFIADITLTVTTVALIVILFYLAITYGFCLCLLYNEKEEDGTPVDVEAYWFKMLKDMYQDFLKMVSRIKNLPLKILKWVGKLVNPFKKGCDT